MSLKNLLINRNTNTSSNNSNNTIRKTTPLPYKQLLIILAVRFTEPVAFTFLFPFLYFMVKDFHLTDDSREIGYYVGLVASSFAIAQIFTGFMWGFLSDRIGRRPIILLGLSGSAISLFLFGLSSDIKFAIFNRVFCGAINGNVGVLKSMTSELTDKTNRAKAFSYLSMVYVLGTILGPILGGYLSNPAQKYKLFDTTLFKTYPYFLPCLICSILCIFGFWFGYLFLEETLDKKQSTKTERNQETSINNENCNSDNYNHNSNNENQVTETTILIQDNITHEDIHNSNNSEADATKKEDKISFFGINKDTWLAIYGAGGLCFQGTLYDELLPLWAATSISNGGLSFGSSDIGTIMSLTGFFSFFMQLFLNHKLQNLLGPLRVYRITSYLSIMLFILHPLVQKLAKNQYYILLWIFFITMSVFRATFNLFGLTSMAHNSESNILGKVNGLDQTIRSISRAIAPLLCGSIFAWSLSNQLNYPFNTYFMWYVIALVAILNSTLAIFSSNKTTQIEQ